MRPKGGALSRNQVSLGKYGSRRVTEAKGDDAVPREARALRPAVVGCIAKAKSSRPPGTRTGAWRVSCAPKAVTQMMPAPGVYVAGDLERLRTNTLGALEVRGDLEPDDT